MPSRSLFRGQVSNFEHPSHFGNARMRVTSKRLVYRRLGGRLFWGRHGLVLAGWLRSTLTSAPFFPWFGLPSLHTPLARKATKATDRNQKVEIPCGACGASGGYEVLRLRMTSTSWASCFAQDDRALFGLRAFEVRAVGFGLRFFWVIQFWIIGVDAGLDGDWGI